MNREQDIQLTFNEIVRACDGDADWVVNVIEEEKLTFGISGKLAPVVIRNEKSNNYTHIIMPLKS